MINLKTNEVLKIEVQSTDNFNSGNVDIFFYQDNSTYGLDNEKIGEVNINLDDKTYTCLYCGSYDEEEFYILADNIILKKIRALGEKAIPDFGRIKDDTGEILKKFILATGIEHTLKSEIEILQESEEELKGYHLCNKPE